jgi:MoaA/NifB/PqqE/SkfB family radical SAM enzyme
MVIMSAPQLVNWNFTYRCNFNCQHCYSRAPSYPEELTPAQYLQIADQLIAAPVFRVGFGGGEVLVRRDCLPIIARLSAAGVAALLTTNGWLLDARRAGELADAGLSALYVSLDSPHPDQHDAFRNKPGGYQRVLLALRAAVAAGLNVYLSTVLTALNVDDVPLMVAIAEREGLAGINFKRFRAAGNGLASKERYQISAEQGQRIEAELARLKERSGLSLSLNFGPEADDEGSTCPCGTRTLTLRPNGDVSPCVFSETVIGNLMHDSLTDLWRNSPDLKAQRAQGTCASLQGRQYPSNPSLRNGRGALEMVN